MKATKAFGVVLALAAAAGLVLALGSSPTTYRIPDDLFFWDPMSRCPTAVSDDVRNSVSWAVPGERIVVRLQERDPTTGEWIRREYVYSTSYRVLDVAYRLGGKELYVSGVRIDGPSYEDLIEKWVFPSLPGSYGFTVDGGETPRGVPRAPLSGSVSIVGGGSYVPVDARARTPQPIATRTLIYSEPEGGHYHAIAADPEGRFLLLHNYTSGDVLSLDLSEPDPTPMLEFAAAQNPVLAAAQTLVMHDVPGVGRICRLTAENRYGAYPSGSNETTILLDLENDGYFDAFSIHPSVDIARGLTPYGSPYDWESAVNFGWDWRAEYQ